LLRDGTKVYFIANSTPPLRDEILVRCRAIPELTAALRAFGSRRGHRSVRVHATRDQQRFFAPLLDARRQAVAAKTPGAAMAAFEASALTTAFDTALRELALDCVRPRAPRARGGAVRRQCSGSTRVGGRTHRSRRAVACGARSAP